MTIVEFDQKPREDWDFCDLWDELRAVIQERDESRKTARQLFRLFRSQLDEPNWLEHEPWLKEEQR